MLHPRHVAVQPDRPEPLAVPLRSSAAWAPRSATAWATFGTVRQSSRRTPRRATTATAMCGPHCRVPEGLPSAASRSFRAWPEVKLPPRLGGAPSTAAHSSRRAWAELPPWPPHGARIRRRRCNLGEWRGDGDQGTRCWGSSSGSGAMPVWSGGGIERKGWGRTREGKGDEKSDSPTDGPTCHSKVGVFKLGALLLEAKFKSKIICGAPTQ
jgi:hypothetical protein